MYRFLMPGEGWRETIDPDDFSSGFGTWSGTSFAAPILAGQLAQCLVDGHCGPLEMVDRPSTVTRAWNALTEQLELRRP
jgi:subtilisin family serine protease